MLTEFNLNGNFDQTTEDDEPHQRESGFGTHNRGRNQLAGANDGS